MTRDTPLLRPYRPPRLVPGLTETSRPHSSLRMQNQSAPSSRSTWSARKRRRVDRPPRAESPASSASISSASASVSSASASVSSAASLTSSSSLSTGGSLSSASTSRLSTSAHSSSSHSASSTSGSQSHTSFPTSSASPSSSRLTITVSRTLTSASSSSFRQASTSVFLSTVITTVSGSTTTVVATSTGALGTSSGGGTPFAHNIGGIVGVAIGSGIALLLGAALLFFTCKHFRRRRGQPEAQVELAPVQAPTTAVSPQPSVPGATAAASDYHYRLARPRMPPAPPSSSSITGLIGRLRGGRASTSSTVPALESTTPLALPSPALRAPRPSSAAAYSFPSPRMPGTPPPGSPRIPGTPPPGSPRPGSLLNPRINVNMPSEPPAPPAAATPKWTGWRPPSAAPAAPAPAEEPPRSPVGLLRPSLAVMQYESSRTLGDHEDYSRPIGGRVDMRTTSEDTVPSAVDPEERGAHTHDE